MYQIYQCSAKVGGAWRNDKLPVPMSSVYQVLRYP